MKNLIIICLFLGTSFSINAQEKVTLTIPQTVEYLQKRLKECEGHYRFPAGAAFSDGVSKKMYYSELFISYSDEKIHLRVESSNYPEYSNNADCFKRYVTQSFNPNQIISITESTTNKSEPLGIIIIKLAGKSCVATQDVQWWKNGYYSFHGTKTINSSDEVGFVYLQQDVTNFNKIKKAFEHLTALCKGANDPFGE